MEKDGEKLNNNSEIIERDENGRLKKGVILNPNGRPKGSRDFYTDFKEAIRRIKDKNSGEALTEQDIIKIGLEKMLKGDARFEGLYKDLLDRVYGKPMQKNEHFGKDGEPIKVVFDTSFNEITPKTKDDSTE